MLNREFPQLPNVPVGVTTPGYRDTLVAKSNVVDGSKAERVLGVTYRPFEDTIIDTALSLNERFNIW